MISNGLKGATTFPGMIRHWWEDAPNANIGVATGEASGIIVLDVDGAEGRDSLNGYSLPDTVTVSSGRTDGGCHYWFRYPGSPVKNVIGLRPGLDIRADGGYVIVPPSRHHSGKLYEWGSPEGFDWEAIAEAPEWLLKLIEEKATTKGPGLGFRPTIPNGERNDTLYREGCKLRGLGWSEAAIFEALKARNQDCEEPLPEAEIRTIAQSAASHDPNPVLQTFRRTDVGNGKRLTTLYRDQIRYSSEEKRWLFWDERRWNRDKIGRVQRLAKATVQETYELGQRLGDTGLQEWAAETERRNGIGRMIESARSEDGISVTAEDLDRNQWLFNVRNGTLNLETGQFLAHNPKQLITKLAPVDFDPEATAPRWEAFLSEVFTGDETLIRFVQKAMGYTLTGDMREQVFFIAYGGGANGKSTLLNTVRRVMGDYAANTPFSTFEADNQNKYGNDMAALKGSRFVTAIESEQDKRLAEARVKTIIGGDPVTCRFLYGEYFTMEPTFKVWLAVNHRANIREQNPGMWRRILPIPFTQSFEGRADKTLAGKLEAEAPGILNWMLDGLRLWKEQTLEPIPDSVLDAKAEYKRDMDTLGEWIEERATVAEGVSALSSELYADYRAWSEQRGESRYTLGLKGFSIQLGERGFKKKHTKKGWVFEGIGLEALRMSETRGS